MDNLWVNDRCLYDFFERKCEVLSLDIFDTLLLRKVKKPNDVFRYVGEQAIKRSLLKYGISATEFKLLRQIAEDRAKRKKFLTFNHKEVTLSEIYHELPENIGNKYQIMKIEIESEKTLTFINPSVFSLIKVYKERHNGKLALLSDMYLSSNEIMDVLSHHEFPIDWIDLLLVSCEHGGDKESGLLFQKLKQSYSMVESECIVHIGDKYTADILGAKNENIGHIHYDVIPSEHHEMFLYERVFKSYDILPEIYSLRKLAVNLDVRVPADKKDWFTLGAGLLGPLLVSFAEWVIDVCLREGKQRVFGLMREGEIISHVINCISRKRDLNIAVKPLYVSRESTVTASYEKIGHAELEEFWDRKNFTVRNLFVTLHLFQEMDTFEEYLDVSLKETNEVLYSRDLCLKQKLYEYILSDSIQQKLDVLISEKRQILFDYLNQEFSGDFSDLITVDIGYRGTIQKSIEKVMKSKSLIPNITHILMIADEKIKYLQFDGLDIRGFIKPEIHHRAVKSAMNISEPLERLMMPECGSVTHYKRIDDTIVVPEMRDNLLAGDSEYSYYIREGVNAYLDLWLSLEARIDIKGTLETTRIIHLGDIIERLIEFPTPIEASKIGELYYEENFGSDTCSQICTQNDIHLISNLGVENFLEVVGFGYYYNGIRWPKAIITRYSPNYLYRKYLEENSTDYYFTLAIFMIKKLMAEKISEIVIYGAGEVGQSIKKIAELYDIKVKYFVDRKQEIWGTYIDGIEVISLEQAKDRLEDKFLIGSVAFITDIKMIIEKVYADSDIKPKIYMLDI
ncbi:hypothetical protein BHU72_00270 [Desulfuribacillus stibiiarsenatis]|uniref:HAD family hydrolase n=1 Tax=Desulfuribacillus stibiiarsenatis TaxID=1390249 RepID=A0A1E5L9E6_9FIRM|nr:hypothetical protein [Desulfuribacillus stibiiarsenatis]OEH86746.1 hypothetical protein BHU72_00270 [Desulfuribacillus stibiiarsenatis]